MSEFKILLEAIIDQSSLSDIEKKLAKEKITLNTQINIEDFSKSKFEIKKQIQLLSKEIKDILGNSITDKEANQWAKHFYRQTISDAKQLAKEQDKINSIQSKNKLSEQNKYYQKILDNNKQIYTLKNKLLSADSKQTIEIEKQTKALAEQNRYSQKQLDKKGLIDNSWIQKINDSKVALEKQYKINTIGFQDKEQARLKSIQDKLKTDINDNSYNVKIDKLVKQFQQYGLTVDEAKEKVLGLKQILSTMENSSGDELITKATKLKTEFKSVKNQLEETKILYNKFAQPVSNEKISSLTNNIHNFLSKNTAITKNAQLQLKKYIAELNGGNISLARWNEINGEFKKTEITMRSLGKLGKSFKDQLSEAANSFTQWFSISSIIMSFLHSIRDGVRLISEFDDAMTDVVYTSDITANGLEKLSNKSMQMGKDMHTSAKNILEAVKIYSTANSTADDILRKTQPAIMLSNVSGMSGSESSKSINTALNQFELKDTKEGLLDIVDTLQYVSSQLNYDFTAGIKEINEAIEASGNVAHNAGLSMQEFAIMSGLAIEKTGQSGSTIGQAEKTIISRITKASKAEGTLDEDISKAETALREIDVKVRDSADEFRDLSDTMHDIGAVWDSLTSVQKSNVGFEVAGTRQLNILNSLFGSWEEYEAIMSNIDDRTGMTMQNQEVYADSLKGHLGDLIAIGESIWTNLLNSEGLKSGVDTLTGLLSILDKLTSSLGLLGTASLVSGGILGAKNVGGAI